MVLSLSSSAPLLANPPFAPFVLPFALCFLLLFVLFFLETLLKPVVKLSLWDALKTAEDSLTLLSVKTRA